MLKKRILTALVLVALFITALFILSPLAFCILMALAVLAAAWEWTYLMGPLKRWHRVAYLVFMTSCMLAVFFVPISYILAIALLWWLAAGWCVARYTENAVGCGKSIFVRGAMGALVLVPCWLAINVLRNTENGPFVLLYLFILVWTADTGAFFVGKRWGKHKMVPAVSPGKTWEGFVGAFITSLVMALCMLFIFKVPYRAWVSLVMVSLMAVLFSILGDLFESMLKRQQGVKDSGRLLPGHGGILDRIDSITAAAPLFTLGILWMNR